VGLVLVSGAGCAVQSGPGGPGHEAVGSAEGADVVTEAPSGDPRLDPTCTNAGDFEVNNARYPRRLRGTCPGTDEYTFGAAAAACDADVKYFSFTCTDDFGDGTHSWTAYYGCCAASCDDGVQNQGETGVDCGGPCAPCTGKIVVNHDEWPLSDHGFDLAPDAATFAVNVASWFTGGRHGNFLAYSNDFGLTGAELAATMTGAGHTWTVSLLVPFTLSTLQQYDGVFLAGNQADNSVLIAYVAGGGHVYLAGGTGFGGAAVEAAQWNTFLGAYNLQLAGVYNDIAGVVPIASMHPIMVGVTGLFCDQGNTVSILDPSNPHTQILSSFDGQGLVAVYQ
jgi:hypothetical protein